MNLTRKDNGKRFSREEDLEEFNQKIHTQRKNSQRVTTY